MRADAAVLGAALWVVAVATSCASRRVIVRSQPDGAHVHRDGRPLAGTTPLAFESPYYGTFLLDLDEPAAGETVYEPATYRLRVDPPATRWIFPFDLPLEAVVWVLGRRSLVLQAQLTPRPVARLDDARARALVELARQAALER